MDGILDPKGVRAAPALARLNLNRTALSCATPLLFAVPQWALRELARSAPDLWALRSGLYRLRGDREAVISALDTIAVDPSGEDRVRRASRRVLLHLMEETANDDAHVRLALLSRLAPVELGLDRYEEAGEAYRRAGDRTRDR